MVSAADEFDARCLSEVARGDSQAVAYLYDRHAVMLFTVSRRIVRQHSEAEDVVHDAFATMHDRAASFSVDRGTVVSWLVTLVRNLSIDRTRRRARQTSILSRDGSVEGTRADTTPEELLTSARGEAGVRRAVETLPDVQKATVELAFFAGLSYPEIAETQGVPIGTVKSRAARALKSLREILDAEGASH